jgi:hypothetical protein
LLHAIRLDVGLSWIKTAAVALGVFVACQVAAAIALQQADIRREMRIDRVLYALPEDPQILIVGSSHTARGLDGDALQAELRVPVAQLSYMGAFAFEQDLALERYFARAKPFLVLIEITTEFAVHTQRAPYAAREIEEADVVRTWWGVRLMMDRSDVTLLGAWDWYGTASARCSPS